MLYILLYRVVYERNKVELIEVVIGARVGTLNKL